MTMSAPRTDYRALLTEVQAQRASSQAAQRAVAEGDALGHLLRARGLVGEQHLRSARQLVKEVLQHDNLAPRLRLVAGLLLFLTHDYDLAVAQLQQAVREEPDFERGWFLLRERCERLGWDKECIAIERERLEREPDSVTWNVWALRTHVRRRNWKRAAEHARIAAQGNRGHAGLQLEAANIFSQIGLAEDTRTSVNLAVLAEPNSLPHRLEAAEVLLRVGEVELAWRHLERALEIEIENTDARLRMAEICLWRGKDDEAEHLAQAILHRAPEHARARRVLAVKEVYAGNPKRALELLNEALERDSTDSEAYVWRAELLRGGDEQQAEQAERDLTRGMMSSNGFTFAAWLLRMMPQDEHGPRRDRYHEVEQGLRLIHPESDRILDSRDGAAIRKLFQDSLRRMRGNRSVVPTILENGEARVIGRVSGLRFECRHALELIRVEEPEVVLAELDEIFERYNKHALAMCHRGEVSVWTGDWDTARRDLEHTVELEPHTRWAYIGLSAVETALGEYEKALEVSQHGVQVMGNTYGPAVFVQEGYALWHLGRFEEASARFREALDTSPKRISTRIGLALCLGSTRSADFLEAFDDLKRRAPTLLSDAARDLDVQLWGDPGDVVSAEDAQRVLEHAVEMFRGNRSSTCQMYYTRENKMRGVEHYPPGARALHDLDSNDEQLITNMLLQQLKGGGQRAAEPPKRRSGPGARESVAKPPRLLSDEQIETFIEQGFVSVPGCVSRKYLDDWVDDAVRRIRSEPERCVKRYDPKDPQRSLTAFDPDDRKSWTWNRINLLGDRNVPAAEIAPKAWAATCDLLGHPDTIKTHTWSNYLILNLDSRIPGGWGPPELSDHSWHVDDPMGFNSLDSIKNGLVLIVLFSDVAHQGGGTFVAPGSHKTVARRMRDEPGVDLTKPEVILEILEETGSILETTGAAGDAFLAHPLLLHVSSANHSGRIRWMANPNIYLREPLQISGKDGAYTPVELAVKRAIDS